MALKILEERKIENVEARNAVCYEQPGVYIPISRIEMRKGVPNTFNRTVEVHFGDFSLDTVMSKFGEDKDGATHFVEHVFSRVADIALSENPDATKRLLEVFPYLHASGVETNAHTSVTGMSFEISVPHKFDYSKVLAYFRTILGENIHEYRDYFEQAIKEEIGRVMNERERADNNREVMRFVSKYLYTGESIENKAIGVLGSNPENLQKINVDGVLELIEDMIHNYPIVIAFHNPPNTLKDEDLLQQVTEVIGDRNASTLVAERDLHHSEYNSGGWLHLEHRRLPSNRTWDTKVSIPIDGLSDRDMEIWRLLEGALFRGPYAPFPTRIQRESGINIYTQNVSLHRSTADLIIGAEVKPEELSSFIRSIDAFISDDTLLNELFKRREGGMSYFEMIRARLIERLSRNNKYSMDIAQDLRHFGKPISSEEEINAISSITEEDIIQFMNKLIDGLRNKKMLTTCGKGQKPQVETFKAINSVILFNMAVQSADRPNERDTIVTGFDEMLKVISD